MSRTETLLLVILGFSLATLIALFFGRLVWAAGLRVGARRMRKQVPSTLVELQTERDRLRAEYAMLSQRLSARLEDARLKLAEQTAEISRYRNRLEGLEADSGGSRTEPAPRSSTEQKLRDELRAVSMQLESALAVQSELQDTLARRRNEQPAAPDQPAARTRSTPEPQPEPEPKSDPQPAPETADVDSDRRLRTHIERLNALASSVARDRADQHQEEVAFRSLPDMQREPVADPLLMERLGQAERETADLQKELAELDAQWARKLSELKDSAASGASAADDLEVANVISLANRIRNLKRDLSTG